MAITPTKLNLSIWRGATFRKVFIYYSGATNLTAPKNLTGYTGRVALRETNGTALAALTTENSGVLLGGINGSITLYISDEDTALITWKTATYELFLTDTAGDTEIYFYGGISVSGS